QTGTERPLGHADALGVALALQRPSREVVVVSEADDPMRRTALAARRPGTVVATVTPEQALAWAGAGFSLFAGRDGSAPVAYVCHDHVCALPARSDAALAEQLR
ncbi:thioredoxin domain-containing protein, partial [Curtobacterium sp. HSID17257]